MTISEKQFEELYDMGIIKENYMYEDYLKLEDKRVVDNFVTDIFAKFIELLRLINMPPKLGPSIRFEKGSNGETLMKFMLGKYSTVREVKGIFE